MEDIKFFAKNEKDLVAVKKYCQDTRMEFVIEKCVMLLMRSGKRHKTERTELPNQEKIRTLGVKESYNYFGILEADTIKQAEMKEKD